MNKKRITLKQVNAALAVRIDPCIELQRGAGYFYFTGIDLYNSSVMTPRLNDLSIDQWIDQFKSLLRDPKNG